MILKILWNKAKFPCFLIWRNDDIKYNDTEIIKNFFDNIKIYFDSENYIKVQNKPVITLKKSKIIKNRLYIISLIRKVSREILGEILYFILNLSFYWKNNPKLVCW